MAGGHPGDRIQAKRMITQVANPRAESEKAAETTAEELVVPGEDRPREIATGERPQNVLRGDPSGFEGVGNPFSRERIGQSGGFSDEKEAISRGGRERKINPNGIASDRPDLPPPRQEVDNVRQLEEATEDRARRWLRQTTHPPRK